MLNSGCFLLILAALPLVQGGLLFPLPDFGNNCAAVTCSTEIEDPQCCNGVEYPNSCLARCSNGGSLTNCQAGGCSGGELDCSVVRCDTRMTDPICCGGKTIGNPCLAQCVEGVQDISQCTPGECGIFPGGPIDCSVVLCASDFSDPLCCNGETVGNPCLAQCVEGIQNVEEQCTKGYCPGDEPVACILIYAPVCCNGQTFSNDCFAKAELGDDIDSICVPGECADQIVCPAVFDPVCCFGDEEYGNSCEASRDYGDLGNFDEVCVAGSCSSQGGPTSVPPLPSCSQPASCFVDPCEFSKCSFEGAVCLSNYCGPTQYLGSSIGGPCAAVWVDPENQVVLTGQQCQGTGGIFGDFGGYAPVCCDGKTYFSIGRAESALGVDAAAELCVGGGCSSFSIFTGFGLP